MCRSDAGFLWSRPVLDKPQLRTRSDLAHCVSTIDEARLATTAEAEPSGVPQARAHRREAEEGTGAAGNGRAEVGEGQAGLDWLGAIATSLPSAYTSRKTS